ncbi:hypothetical protein [Micromonospora sp. NPDC049799]|uniref:hypothetical protein n=1 Tax=Micromonospora sp. NPDC049799 TaxID=3154741 RepID=UPI00340CCD00
MVRPSQGGAQRSGQGSGAVFHRGLTGQVGVRLDSGDLAALAVHARAILDRAGLSQAQIVASGSLGEDIIVALVTQGVPIDPYGYGTSMAV